MLSEIYKNKSDDLLEKYEEDYISYDEYMSSLEQIKKEEIKTINPIIGSSYLKEKEVEILEYERYQRKSLKNHKEEQEEKIRIKSLSEQERYMEKEVPKIIANYRKESKYNRTIHNIFQWAIIVGSVIVTSTTGTTVITNESGLSQYLKWIAAFCSILVTISAGATGYFKFRERSSNLQETADDIEQDYKSINLKTGIYREAKSREEALSIFAERVLHRIEEQKKREQVLEQAPDIKRERIQGT